MIRLLEEKDNAAIRNIIKTVMPQFGAGGQGFAIHDREVENMYEAYANSRCAYFVCEENGKILGGAGIAPLEGGDADICELKKMYFLPEARGKGLGQEILSECLKAAKKIGFKYCYIETFNTMAGAMKLYEKNAFKKIPEPCGNTGHFACDIFYKREV